jgi:hypothetical protein
MPSPPRIYGFLNLRAQDRDQEQDSGSRGNIMATFTIVGAIGLFLFFSALVTGNRPATNR